MRWTMMVRNGSFAEASANASLASTSVTPSISNSTLPGWISDTKYSGLPLPLPMRTSAGFCEIGLSGEMRIQMRPPRLMWRVMARRAASIWRAVSRPRPIAFRPYSPKLTLLPRVALPVLRPFCSLRYLRLAGCSTSGSCSSGRATWFARRGLFRRRGGRGGVGNDLGRIVKRHDFALEHPHLDADDAVGGLRFRKAV